MNQRYYSLDVFRGATVALMILVNNPGSWSYIFPPLEHAKWHGCTPTDLVFPFFLFAVGNAMAFVMPKFEERGTLFFLQKVMKRTLLIFAIGIFLSWSPFVKWDGNALIAKTWEKVRIFGVLQRIAICYCLASCIIYFFKTRWAFVIGCLLLLFYWIACLLAGDATAPFSIWGFWGTSVDVQLLGQTHIYTGEGVLFDPEGPSSTFAAIVQVIFGYLVGQYIQQKGKSTDMLNQLFMIGLILTVAGCCWDLVFPINKKIWTSSYTVYTSGLAILCLASLIFLIEFKGSKGVWSKFFDVFGKNPLFIFVLSGFLPRLLALIRIFDHINPKTNKPIFLSPLGWFYEHVCKNIVPSDLRFGSFIYAVIMIAFYWLIVFWMDKKKIYVKV